MIILSAASFKKQVGRVPQKVRDALRKRLRLFAHDALNPILNNHPLHGEYAGKRSINITGDYRAIFEEKGDMVIFIAIGRHRDLYE